MESQAARAEAFQSLHARPGAFAIPNPWDAGSAKMLATLGFEALATTSAGFAFSLGRPDAEGAIGRAETLANARAIVDATSLPVSADLENGFGDDPGTCAETILLAAAAGLVGGSIEDATGHPNDPIYSYDLSIARVKAAVKAARSLPFPFILTARAENLISGRPDLPNTIRRLASPRPSTARTVVMGLSGPSLSLDALASLGVKRVSLGSSLARAAYGAFLQAAREVKLKGTFDFALEAISYAEINAMFKG